MKMHMKKDLKKETEEQKNKKKENSGGNDASVTASGTLGTTASVGSVGLSTLQGPGNTEKNPRKKGGRRVRGGHRGGRKRRKNK